MGKAFLSFSAVSILMGLARNYFRRKNRTPDSFFQLLLLWEMIVWLSHVTRKFSHQRRKKSTGITTFPTNLFQECQKRSHGRFLLHARSSDGVLSPFSVAKPILARIMKEPSQTWIPMSLKESVVIFTYIKWYMMGTSHCEEDFKSPLTAIYELELRLEEMTKYMVTLEKDSSGFGLGIVAMGVDPDIERLGDQGFSFFIRAPPSKFKMDS